MDNFPNFSLDFENYFLKGIKQHCLYFYPILETCYDAAEHLQSRKKTQLCFIFSQNFLVFAVS